MKGTGHVPGELGTQRELPRTLREAWPVAVFPLPLGMSCSKAHFQRNDCTFSLPYLSCPKELPKGVLTDCFLSFYPDK